MSKIVSFLYNLARKANDIEKLTSGDPMKIARRIKNKFIGRKISKIWKFPF
jgi:siroheme synthase